MRRRGYCEPRKAVLGPWVAVQSRREAHDLELFWRLSGQLGLAVAQGPDGRVFDAVHMGARGKLWELS